MSSDTTLASAYRKIEEAISRNDFRSAEHLIEKYREELTEGEIQTLRRLAEQKQKANVREARRRQRQRRWDRRLGRHPILSILISKEGVLFALIGLFLILGIINLPYTAQFYYHVRSGIGNPQRTQSGEIIGMLLWMIAAVFCGVASITPTFPKKKKDKGYTVACIIFTGISLIELIQIIWRLTHGGY